jgi:chloramphenicol O-acetyltransferase type B
MRDSLVASLHALIQELEHLAMRWWKKNSLRPDQPRLVGSPSKGWTGQAGLSAIEIGRFSYGMENATIRQWGEGAALRMGAFCSIAHGLTVFLGGNHRVDWATTFPFGHVFRDDLGGHDILGCPQSKGDIMVGNDVWIGANVTILSGIEIGHGAVIAATATVTRSIGAYEIWGGNPARLIRPRFDPGIVSRLQALRWWECSIGTIRELVPLLSIPPDGAVLDRLEEIVARNPSKNERPPKNGPV